MGSSRNVTEFSLVVLNPNPNGQVALFFIIYIVTMPGNLLIVVTVLARSSLGSMMYLFLAYLLLMDALFPLSSQQSCLYAS